MNTTGRTRVETPGTCGRCEARRLVGSFVSEAAHGRIALEDTPTQASIALDEDSRRQLVALIAAVAESDANRIATLVRQWVAPNRDLINIIDRSTIADRIDWSISGLAWTLRGIDDHVRRRGGEVPALNAFTAGLLTRLDRLHDADPDLLGGIARGDVLAWLAPVGTSTKAAG